MNVMSARDRATLALLGIVLLDLVAFPAPASALDRGDWITTHLETPLYAHAEGDEVLSYVPQWASFRVDGPVLEGRIWVWSPYAEGHGWIPSEAVGPGAAPTRDAIQAFWEDLWRSQVLERRLGSARDYLYAKYPGYAAFLDCVALRESNWQNIPNRIGSGAFGPFQFMRATFYSTQTGQAGGDWRNPHDQVDAAVDMLRAGRIYEWSVVSLGLC